MEDTLPSRRRHPPVAETGRYGRTIGARARLEVTRGGERRPVDADHVGDAGPGTKCPLGVKAGWALVPQGDELGEVHQLLRLGAEGVLGEEDPAKLFDGLDGVEAPRGLGQRDAFVDAGRDGAEDPSVAVPDDLGTLGAARRAHPRTGAIDAWTASRAPSGKSTAPPTAWAASGGLAPDPGSWSSPRAAHEVGDLALHLGPGAGVDLLP